MIACIKILIEKLEDKIKIIPKDVQNDRIFFKWEFFFLSEVMQERVK